MDPAGHEFLTKESLKAAVRNLPADLNWIRSYLPDAVITGDVYRDMEDSVTFNQFSRGGQKHHFMQFAGQGAWKAYKAGHDWIYDRAYEAVKRLRRIWKLPLHGAKLPDTVEHFHNSVERFGGDPFRHGFDHSADDFVNYNPLIDVAGPLGDAFHAVQDSYSPGHTRRKKVGDRWIIDDVFIWDAKNKQTHVALDKEWKSDELGKEAIAAGRELIWRVVASSVVRTDHEVKGKWDSLWGTFAAGFLGQNLGSEPGHYPNQSTR
jgi:hypothetical protein